MPYFLSHFQSRSFPLQLNRSRKIWKTHSLTAATLPWFASQIGYQKFVSSVVFPFLATWPITVSRSLAFFEGIRYLLQLSVLIQFHRLAKLSWVTSAVLAFSAKAYSRGDEIARKSRTIWSQEVSKTFIDNRIVIGCTYTHLNRCLLFKPLSFPLLFILLREVEVFHSAATFTCKYLARIQYLESHELP